jgi:hypothetical protein
MNLEYKKFLNPDFPPESKVWIYQSSRLLKMDEAFTAEEMLKEFVANWKSHGKPVTAQGLILFGYFLVLIADETQTHVGGCSTDTSQRLIKTIGEKFQINFFDRNQLAFVVNDGIEFLPYQQVPYALKHHFLSGDTLYFNNLVSTKKELEEKWMIPIKESWLADKVEM